MFTERAFNSGELLLNYAAGPVTGPPLLLLHGITRCWRDFLTLVPSLAPRWQVHGLDFRGHGRSGRCPGKYLVVDYVRDAAAVLKKQLTGPAVVYGHSLGALVAAALAAREPELVRGVVLEDPPGPALLHEIRNTPYQALFAGLREVAARRSPVQKMAGELAEIQLPAPNGGTTRLGQLRDASSLRFGARCLQDLDPEVLTPLLEGRWLEGHDSESVWAGIRCPVLLLRGDVAFGGMLTRQESEHAAGRMEDCTLIDLPGVGHLVHWMQAETTARLVVGFLESLL